MNYPGGNVNSPKVGNPKGPVSGENESLWDWRPVLTAAGFACNDPMRRIRRGEPSIRQHRYVYIGHDLGRRAVSHVGFKQTSRWPFFQSQEVILLFSVNGFKRQIAGWCQPRAARKDLVPTAKLMLVLLGSFEGADRPSGGGDSPLLWWAFLAKSGCLIP